MSVCRIRVVYPCRDTPGVAASPEYFGWVDRVRRAFAGLGWRIVDLAGGVPPGAVGVQIGGVERILRTERDVMQGIASRSYTSSGVASDSGVAPVSRPDSITLAADLVGWVVFGDGSDRTKMLGPENDGGPSLKGLEAVPLKRRVVRRRHVAAVNAAVPRW